MKNFKLTDLGYPSDKVPDGYEVVTIKSVNRLAAGDTILDYDMKPRLLPTAIQPTSRAQYAILDRTRPPNLLVPITDDLVIVCARYVGGTKRCLYDATKKPTTKLSLI